MNIYEGIEKEFDFLTQTYDAEIRAIKSNPNTPASIDIYYKEIYAYVQKSGGEYFLDIWLKHKPVFHNETIIEKHPWSKVLAELDKWIPIKKQTALL